MWTGLGQFKKSLIDLNLLISNSWKLVTKNHYFINITSATIITTIPIGICAVARLVRVLSYSRKAASSIPQGVIWIFCWRNPFGCTIVLGSTQPLTDMSTNDISWGSRWPVRGADNLTTFIFRLSRNSGSLKFLELYLSFTISITTTAATISNNTLTTTSVLSSPTFMKLWRFLTLSIKDMDPVMRGKTRFKIGNRSDIIPDRLPERLRWTPCRSFCNSSLSLAYRLPVIIFQRIFSVGILNRL
jgi:hypothetical protein